MSVAPEPIESNHLAKRDTSAPLPLLSVLLSLHSRFQVSQPSSSKHEHELLHSRDNGGWRRYHYSPEMMNFDGGEKDAVVQYVVLRRDLINVCPIESVATQGCHASMAAVWTHHGHPDMVAYCSDAYVDSMHKVTLEVKGETQLHNLSDKLAAMGIDYKLWIEQPENIPTCLATRPCPKSHVASFFKKLKLCK